MLGGRNVDFFSCNFCGRRESRKFKCDCQESQESAIRRAATQSIEQALDKVNAEREAPEAVNHPNKLKAGEDA